MRTTSPASLGERGVHSLAIAERPAWPRHIHIVEAIPLTTVGKIYKPQLRCDAAERLVKQVVHGQMKLGDAAIQVREGGRRGMTVSVRLPSGLDATVPQVREALSGFLFEVGVASSPVQQPRPG